MMVVVGWTLAVGDSGRWKVVTPKDGRWKVVTPEEQVGDSGIWGLLKLGTLEERSPLFYLSHPNFFYPRPYNHFRIYR